MSSSEVDDCMTFISSINIWSDQQYNMWNQKFSQVCYLCLIASYHLFEKVLTIFHGILFHKDRNEAAQCLNSFSFQVIGQICTMSSVELRRMAIVANTLSENEISCLENLDDDAVASLGALSQWSQTQVSVICFWIL